MTNAPDNEELFADVRNKLQAAKTALELLKTSKKVSQNLIDIAIKDLAKVEDMIS